MLCSHCRHIIPDGSKTCSYCGATMPVQSVSRKPQKQNFVPLNAYEKRTQEEKSNMQQRYNRQISALYENPKESSGRGREAADASLILGIVGIACWFSGYSSIVSIIVGIIGLRLASVAKQKGYDGWERNIGFSLSLFSFLGGLIILIFVVGFFATLFNAG